MNLNEIVLEVQQWAREVGSLQNKFFRSEEVRVYEKGVQDLVTQVDKQSESYLQDKIKTNFPEHGFLGEESGYMGRKDSEYCWIIDPLDGTHNFIHGIPIFAVSIALCHQERTILGVVYAPYLDEMYHAILGGGAYLGDKKLQVSSETKLSGCFLASGFPYDKGTHPDNNLAYVNELVPQIRGLRRLGAAAYDLALVAAGYLDGYWELNLKIWDIAAGRLLVEEAGGEVLNWKPERKVAILAGNKKICKKLSDVFTQIDKNLLL